MQGSLEIRMLEAGDDALLLQAVNLTDEGPLEASRTDGFLREKDLLLLVAMVDGSVVGFIYGYILRRFEATSLFIYSVDVAEGYQGQGIGTAMMQALSKAAQKHFCDEMFVFTNQHNARAMALYRRAGGVRPNDDDVMFDFYFGEH